MGLRLLLCINSWQLLRGRICCANLSLLSQNQIFRVARARPHKEVVNLAFCIANLTVESLNASFADIADISIIKQCETAALANQWLRWWR